MRYRLGFRLKLPLGLFPNAAIFVVHLDPASASKCSSGISQIQSALQAAGRHDLSAALVFELA